jgi:hypothetical protein
MGLARHKGGLLKSLPGIALAIAGALAISTNASAASYAFSVCNQAALCGAGTVNTNLVGGNIVVDVDMNSGFGLGNGGGGDTFALTWTGGTLLQSWITGLTAGFTCCDVPSDNMDGFGTFQLGYSSTFSPNAPATGANALVFTIDRPTDFTLADLNLFAFAAHAVTLPTGAGQVTGFVRTGTPNCVDCGFTVTPEPASMLLLGTGLGLVAMRLRRKSAKRA